jgi:glycosyltransferase involved in cell wall biosynthesis
MINLARGFVERGHDVDLVVARADGPLLADVPEEARLVDLRSRGVLSSLPRLIRYIRRERPAVMLSTMSHCNVVAIIARSISRSRMRLIVREANTMTFHGYRRLSARERIVFYLMMMLYSKAETVVANSLDTASDLVSHGITDEDGVVVIHNPLVSPDLIARQDAAAEHPFLTGSGIPLVLGIGRLHAQKDFETMVRAFGIVRRDRPAHLIILGEGSERDMLQDVIKELGLEDCVDLPGFVANPHAFISRASVVALSSRWEGFGNVLVEALAAGTPVVSTDCPGGPAEILEHGAFGRLVPVGDTESLAGALLATLDDPPARDRLIERAGDFSIEAITARYMEVLDIQPR